MAGEPVRCIDCSHRREGELDRSNGGGNLSTHTHARVGVGGDDADQLRRHTRQHLFSPEQTFIQHL